MITYVAEFTGTIEVKGADTIEALLQLTKDIGRTPNIVIESLVLTKK